VAELDARSACLGDCHGRLMLGVGGAQAPQ
jgi:hypothetical protein